MISTFFSNEKNSFNKSKLDISNESYNSKANLVLKKVFIQMISVLQLMKIYVNMSLNKQHFDCISFDQQTLKYNTALIRQILNTNSTNENQPNSKFRINESLLGLSLTDLIAKIRVKDISTYVMLTSIYMSGKESSREIYLSTDLHFPTNIKANETILFYKSKRKDELVKFAFKFTRKQLLSIYKSQLINKYPKIKASEVRERFNSEILNNHKLAIDYFYSMEVNKKNLRYLHENPKAVQLFRDYQRNHFLEDQINSNIFRKKENIFRGDVTLPQFLRKIFIVQSKNNVTLQNILNSLYIFDAFFNLS